MALTKKQKDETMKVLTDFLVESFDYQEMQTGVKGLSICKYPAGVYTSGKNKGQSNGKPSRLTLIIKNPDGFRNKLVLTSKLLSIIKDVVNNSLTEDLLSLIESNQSSTSKPTTDNNALVNALKTTTK